MFLSRAGRRNLFVFIRRIVLRTRSVSDLDLSPIRSSSSLVTSQLSTRALVRLTGEDTFPFLQGLITNDISHVEGPDGGPLFALLLNHQGRVLYDVIIYSQTGQTLLECDLSIHPQLIKHLTLYRVKKKVVIADASSEITPWVVFKQISDNETPPTATDSVTADKKKELVIGDHKGISDPRLCQLGWRFLLPKGQELDLTSVKVEDYKKLRYFLGVGEGVKDTPVGNSFPLESNGDYLHGVSFHKGCYVGQELTARTHHTGVIRKRLMPFVLPDGADFPSETDTSKLEIKTPGGKSVGKVRDIIGQYGLALTRIEEALSGSDLKIGELSVSVKRPFWWPIELPKGQRSS